MTTEQAIQLIDQALSQMTLTRVQHAQLMEALKVLREAAKREP
jgi:hypothetical protein